MSRTPQAPTIDPAEIVGIQDIALRLRVAVQTVNSWQLRAQETRRAIADRGGDTTGLRLPMPEPDGYLSGAPWWLWTRTIVPWARATGRHPGSSRA